MTTEALHTLTKLITGGKTREERLKTLLRPPERAAAHWFMHLPPAFNNALDIRRTVRVGERELVWTQGANFSFSVGDTIFDNEAGYGPWDAALKQIRFCFQVSNATAVSPPNPRSPRQSGSVTFTVSIPNEQRTVLSVVRTHTVTQDEFVRFLIVGFPDELPLA